MKSKSMVALVLFVLEVRFVMLMCVQVLRGQVKSWDSRIKLEIVVV